MGMGALLVVLVVVSLVFGPGRLPEMMGNLGYGDGLLRTNPIDNQKVCRNPTFAKSAADVFAWVFEAKE